MWAHCYRWNSHSRSIEKRRDVLTTQEDIKFTVKYSTPPVVPPEWAIPLREETNGGPRAGRVLPVKPKVKALLRKRKSWRDPPDPPIPPDPDPAPFASPANVEGFFSKSQLDQWLRGELDTRPLRPEPGSSISRKRDTNHINFSGRCFTLAHVM